MMLSKPLLSAYLFLLLLMVACSTNQGLFKGKKTPHETYSDKIEEAGLKSTSLGNSWFMSADKSLRQPVTIELPYEEKGYFSQSQPRAAGFKFNARRGEMIKVSVQTVPQNGFLFFAELWQPGQENKFKLLQAADTATKALEHEADMDGTFILRIQPELLRSVEYTLRITTAPSLAFPVRETDKPRITSYWGAERDGGARNHEGVDIFGRRHTPVMACANGVVTRVNENNLGGKVVFLRPDEKNYSLYYAHLDSQLVAAGERVKTGDIIGLMGNTGNARTTSPHLHFGIYTSGGAVDPLPFINKERPLPASPKFPVGDLNSYRRVTGTATVYEWPSSKAGILQKTVTGDLFHLLAVTDDWYRILLPDGREGYIPGKQTTAQSWRNEKLDTFARLLDMPELRSPAIAELKPGTSVSILGKHGTFYRVRSGEMEGWVAEADL